MLILAALLPILVPIVLLSVFNMTARHSMIITATLVCIVAFFIWQMTPVAVAASGLQGIHRALTIIWILVGAITFLYVVRATGALDRIRRGFDVISKDMRVQVVVIGFAFLSLIEGVSGFGTPAIVVAPLLVALGFRPIVAVCITLVSDTVACTFGAVGTPLLVGLENTKSYGIDFILDVAKQVTAFDIVIATFMPIALVAILVGWFGEGSKRQRLADIIDIAPWGLLIGLSYSATAFIVVRTIGVEFTAIVSGLMALVVALITLKFNILQPKNKLWHSKLATSDKHKTFSQIDVTMPLWRAWLPYIMVIVLLLVTRVVPGIKQFALSAIDLSWMHILGVGGISSSWQLLYSPGTILILSALIALITQGGSAGVMMRSFGRAIKVACAASLTLIPTLIMVQVFTNSSFNAANFASMPVYIGNTLAQMVGQFWVIFAPLLGGLGAFIAGSVTVSNLTLASVQENIAYSADLPVNLVVALQILGAVAGNAIAVHNVVAVCSVTGLAGKEGFVIRRVLPVALIYVLVIVLIGLFVWILGL